MVFDQVFKKDDAVSDPEDLKQVVKILEVKNSHQNKPAEYDLDTDAKLTKYEIKRLKELFHQPAGPNKVPRIVSLNFEHTLTALQKNKYQPLTLEMQQEIIYANSIYDQVEKKILRYESRHKKSSLDDCYIKVLKKLKGFISINGSKPELPGAKKNDSDSDEDGSDSDEDAPEEKQDESHSSTSGQGRFNRQNRHSKNNGKNNRATSRKTKEEGSSEETKRSSGKGMSTGQQVGIAVGSVLGVMFIQGLVLFFTKTSQYQPSAAQKPDLRRQYAFHNQKSF